MLRADCDAVIPTTGPSPAAAHARPVSVSTRVLPDPAGALMTDARWPSVRTDSAAAAWSSRSPVRVRVSCVASRVAGQRGVELRGVGAERVRGLRAVRRGAPLARACASMRSSMTSCARVAYRVPPCRW